MGRVLTLTGPSGCGKSTVVHQLLSLAGDSFAPSLVPKYTTRQPRKDDGVEIKCVGEIPKKCDMVYEQYGVRYGLESSTLYDHLGSGRSPLIILNDVRTVADLKNALGECVQSIFVFREGPKLEHYRELASARGVSDERDLEQRFRKAQAIYRIYIENIDLFDHVILNSGSIEDLRTQVRQIVVGLNQELNWPMRKDKR